MIVSQLPGHYDVIGNRLWSQQQNANWVSETRERCVKIVILSSFMDSFCRVRNEEMCVLSWWTVSALTRVLFWSLFPELLQNNPLMSAETVHHSSTYIILYFVIWSRELDAPSACQLPKVTRANGGTHISSAEKYLSAINGNSILPVLWQERGPK